MPADKFLLDAQGSADPADLVLEKRTQRLDNLQVHLLRKTAHIVVGLDLGGDALDAGGLDHVRIDGSLGEPAGVLDGAGVFVEGLHEEPSDDLSLGLRLGNAGESVKELLGRVGSDDIEVHVLVRSQHILIFILSQQAVVHEYAGEVVADGLVQQHACYRRIDTAAESEDYLLVPYLFPEAGYCRLDERGRSPVTLAAAYSQSEIAEDFRAFSRVEDLRVELHGVGLLALDVKSSVGDALGRGDHLRALRQTGDRVPVRHPDL